MSANKFINKISLIPNHPEAWFLPKGVQDVRAENKSIGSITHMEVIRMCGICCWKVDPDMFASPIHARHSQDTVSLSDIQHQDNSCANIIEMNSDHFIQDSAKVGDNMPQHSSFLFNGRKPKEILCYVLVSSGGYFDVEFDGVWIRMRMTKGDLITLPEDLYHRFTTPCVADHNVEKDPQYFAGTSFNTPLVRIALD